MRADCQDRHSNKTTSAGYEVESYDMLCCREGEGTAIGLRTDHVVGDKQGQLEGIEMHSTTATWCKPLPKTEELLLEATQRACCLTLAWPLQ